MTKKPYLSLTEDGCLGITVKDPRGAGGGIVAHIKDRDGLEVLREMFKRAEATYLTPTEERIADAVVRKLAQKLDGRAH